MSFLPKQTVVVPIDFSEASFAALETAYELATNVSALRVIHVLPDLEPTEPGVIWDTVDNESRKRNVESSFREQIKDTRYSEAALTVAFGNAGREISAFAQREAADLIVLPSHGRTGVKRLLIGSVAELVVRHAHCPVLVLKQ